MHPCIHMCVYIQGYGKEKDLEGIEINEQESKRICVSWKQKGRVVEWRRAGIGGIS